MTDSVICGGGAAAGGSLCGAGGRRTNSVSAQLVRDRSNPIVATKWYLDVRNISSLLFHPPTTVGPSLEELDDQT